jgi:hypothetical protein
VPTAAATRRQPVNDRPSAAATAVENAVTARVGSGCEVWTSAATVAVGAAAEVVTPASMSAGMHDRGVSVKTHYRL